MGVMRVRRGRVKQLADKWVRRFRLDDWTISVTVVQWEDMNPDVELAGSVKYGQANWDPHERVAWIHIVDPHTIPPEYRDGSSLETLLVHELLHVLITGHMAATDDVNFERVVRVLTECLVPTKGGER